MRSGHSLADPPSLAAASMTTPALNVATTRDELKSPLRSAAVAIGYGYRAR